MCRAKLVRRRGSYPTSPCKLREEEKILKHTDVKCHQGRPIPFCKIQLDPLTNKKSLRGRDNSSEDSETSEPRHRSQINDKPLCAFDSSNIAGSKKIWMPISIKESCIKLSSKQFDIQSNRAHEEVNVPKSLAGHIWGKCLRKSHGLHNPVLDSHNQSLLLIRTCANADCGQELPDVDIFTSVNRTRENGRKTWFKGIKEFVVNGNPVVISIALKNQSLNLPLLPLMLFGTSRLLDKLSPAENHGQHADPDSCSGNNVDIDIENETQNTSYNI